MVGEIGTCLLDASGIVRSVDAGFARWFEPRPRVGAPLELPELSLAAGSGVAPPIPAPGVVLLRRGATTLELRCEALDPSASPLAFQLLLVPQTGERETSLVNALAIARETLRSLVDACPVTIVTTDMDLRVTMWNRSGEAMFGWTEAELLGQPYPLVPAAAHGEFAKLLAKVYAGEGFTGVEAERERKDGSRIPVRMHTAPLRDASGSVVGGLALLEDLSHTRALERQKMEAIGRLAGGVAHDFNNLLAIILGMTELLVEDPSLQPSAREQVGEIRRASESAKRITSQLLTFGRREIVPARALDLHATLRATLPILRRLVGDTVELELALAEGVANVPIEAAQLEQVLINLAVNARDAMPEGGLLTLRSRRVADAGGRPKVELEVADRGTGIPPEVLPHLFEPFFTTKPEGRGTGLGLATVFGIVRASGGTIRVESELGQGARFILALPLLDAPSVGRSGDKASLPRGSERLLVVDDEPSVRRSMARLLASLGYALESAANGDEALAQVRNRAFDLVLTDLSMPRMTGTQLAARIRELAPQLPIVFMSGNLDSEELRAEIAAGRAEFLQKPVALTELAVAIRRVLDERRAAQVHEVPTRVSPTSGR